ncbi:hypothetical protein Leryth_005979 [Lithospermum erythrorhizon]|nr:hypothetical protein Leryth_005979 [Lithospermum erythrorhizon]
MTTLQGPNQASQGQYMSSSSHYQGSQMQDMSRIAPHQTQSQVNQPSQVQPVANYQHQWSQQLPQSSMQPQIKAASPAAYPSYLQGQPNPPSAEMVSHSGPMQVPHSGVPQPGANHQEAMPYSYGGSSRPGYRGEHAVAVIQRLEENGQPVDFNAVLDRLNGHSSGGSQRGWSG